jgi:arylsulfatase A-like enzyme
VSRAIARTLSPFALSLLACLGGGSCRPAPGTDWIHLAGLFETAELQREEADLRAPDGRELRVQHADDHALLSVELQREDWILRTAPTLWRTRVGLRANGQPAEGEPERLWNAQREFTYQRHSMLQDKEVATGAFQTLRDELMLRLAENQEPPAQLRFEVYAERGHAAGGLWRVRGRRYSGEALSVWPGESWRCSVDVPARRVLRFATALEPVFATSGQQRGVTFRVRLDGQEIFAHTHDDPGRGGAEQHRVELPASGRSRAELVFSVEGAPAYTAFLVPVIGPAEVGTYGERPWQAPRRDLIVYLADTFRADNLTAYGGQSEVTPFLDELAERSLLFRRAWSVSTYTLPAHATMFSGLFPRQAGVLGTSRALPEELVTIAEHLASFGYRTGAVTDSVVVSSRFAMDQGFEWFEEIDPDEHAIENTNQAVQRFLDADDGRPLFLFVQTYRTHLPYRVSPETRRAHGERLGIERQFGEIMQDYEALMRIPTPTERDVAQRARLWEMLRAHYLGGVLDLDRGFADLHRDLEARGLFESGVLIFTSDHGEAFGEHGRLFHTGRVFEEQSRVPLFVYGGGVRAGVVDDAVSLVDLSPTLARLAGAPPPEHWLGTPLLESREGRVVFVFECKRHERSTLAIVDGARKVIGYEDAAALERGEVFAAFDLEADPYEQDDQVRRGAGWPQELLERYGPAAAPLLEPVVGPAAAELDPDSLRKLRELGYGGD